MLRSSQPENPDLGQNPQPTAKKREIRRWGHEAAPPRTGRLRNRHTGAEMERDDILPPSPARKISPGEPGSGARRPRGTKQRNTRRDDARRRIARGPLSQLREHPAFLLDALHEPDARGYPTQAFVEGDREALYELELLRMFKQRIRLVALLGLLVVPFFAAFYWYLAPDTFQGVAQFFGLLVVALVTICFLTVPVSSLAGARLLAFSGYSLFSIGVAVIINVISQDAGASPAVNAVQFTVLASYVHILLSILLMPFSVWETLVTVALMTAGIGWGLRQTAPGDNSPALMAQAFVLLTTAMLVLCISHLQNVLRRRAFDSAFDLNQQAAQMQEVSATDALTGGYNRRHMEETLAIELTRAARFHRPLSLIMFDLDNFKPVNDTLGHAAGDEVLREIHRAAAQVLREVDALSRFGGDEFLVVLPETDLQAARTVAQRIRNATSMGLRERFGSQALESRVTLSMGVLTIQDNEPMAVIEAVSRVDALLYEAKRGGKNRISVGA